MLAAVVANLKRPLAFKKLRYKYNIQRRDKLATSIKDIRLSGSVLEHYRALTDQMDDLEDDLEDAYAEDEENEEYIEDLEDEQDDLDEDLQECLGIFLGISCEEEFHHPGVSKRVFTIEEDVVDGDVSSTYRFRNKRDLRRVMDCLQLPLRCGPFKGGGNKRGCWKNREELFCFYLARLCAPSDSLRKTVKLLNFGGEYTVWSRGFNWLACWLQTRWGYKLYDNLDFFQPRWEIYSECIRLKAMDVSLSFPLRPNPSPALQYAQGDFSICSFIDCNLTGTCRLGSGPLADGHLAPRNPLALILQQSIYNGWARKHGMKHETSEAPDGLSQHAYGPGSLRHSDLWFLGRGGINTKFYNIQVHLPGNQQKKMYGDSIYPFMSHLRSRHGPNNPTPMQRSEDLALSSCRECIEHSYGESSQLFPYLNYHEKLKLANQPLGAIYFTKLLFRNMYNCLYHNNTSKRFNCPPPTLEEYMAE